MTICRSQNCLNKKLQHNVDTKYCTRSTARCWSVYSHFVATTQNHNKKAREIIGCKRTAFQMAERAFCAVLLYMGNKPNCLMRRGQATLLGRSMPTLSIIGLQFPTKMASWSARFLKHYVTTSLRKYTEITYSTNVWLCDMIARHLDLYLRYYCETIPTISTQTKIAPLGKT